MSLQNNIPSKNSNNPFESEENLKTIFSTSTQYQDKKKAAMQNYYKINESQFKNTNFMSNLYNKTIQLFSKHVAITTILLGLVLTTVSVSATQLIAPNNYKPTSIIQNSYKNIFGKNDQVEKDPFTALKPDENNDVVSVSDCDLSIKYPKSIAGMKVDSFDLDSDYYVDKSISGVSLYNLPDLNKSYNDQIRLNQFSVACSDKSQIFSPERYSPISIGDIRKATGWFITIETDLKNVQVSKISSEENNPFVEYYFEYKNKFYTVQTVDKELLQKYDEQFIGNRGGITQNQVQIQFNSLVTNESNVVPKPAPKTIKNDNTQAIDIKLKNSNKLFKFTNDIQTAKTDGDTTSDIICGAPNTIEYRDIKSAIADNKATMVIGNKKDYVNDKELDNNYKRVMTYLSNPSDTNTDTLTGAFINYCGAGFYSNYVANIDAVKYNNVDKYKVSLVLEGNGEFGNPVVRIYARKGVNIITIRKEVNGIVAADYFNQYAKECANKVGLDSTNCDKKFIENYNNKIKSTESLAKAKVVAQELADLFEITN